MALYSTRKHVDRVLVPIVRQFARVPLSANGWTLLGTVIGIASAYSFYTGCLAIGMALFTLRGLIDHIDGYVARTRNQKTAFGAIMDDVSDRWVMGIQYGGAALWLAKTYPHILWVMVVGMAGAFTNAILKLSVYAETTDVQRDTEGKVAHPIDGVGYFGSAEFMIYLGVPFLIMLVYPNPVVGAVGIWCVAIASQISLLRRIVFCWSRYRVIR